ncbi:MAG: hypothetical protein CMP11_05050 [Zetaproteobacteria bacterium]|nr:hypothetical protein [Pseudobdellovibrionaceae bacterium]
MTDSKDSNIHYQTLKDQKKEHTRNAKAKRKEDYKLMKESKKREESLVREKKEKAKYDKLWMSMKKASELKPSSSSD